MSSVDKLPDWSLFQEREILVPGDELLSPVAEITATLRATNRTLTSAQQVSHDLAQSSFTELARQAILVVQLGALLERSAEIFRASAEQQQTKALARVYKSLQIIQKQMLDELQKAGLEIELPLHKTYAEVAEYVEIDQWQHLEDLSAELVVDVLEPVLRRGALLRAGRVIMGAPLHARPSGTQDESEAAEQVDLHVRKAEPADG